MKKYAFHIIIVIIVGLLSYSNIFHVPFVFDDVHSIVENPKIRDLSSFFDSDGLRSPRYLGFLSFALNYAVNGLNVAGYHAVNIIIHIINALLVYVLILLTMRTPWFRERLHESRLISYLPLLVTLLFVSHPLQSQSVTYIVQRFASLAALFFLLCLVLYIISRLTKGRGMRSILYILSLIAAVCAMKSKENSFTLPLVITLYEIFFFKDTMKRRVLRLIPLYATMLIIPLSLVGIDKPLGELIGDVSEVTKVQTSLSRWEYLMTQFRVIMTYLRLVAVPINQNLNYDYPVFRSFFDPNVWLSFLVLAGFFGMALHLLYRSGRVDGTDNLLNPALSRLISFGILWFFITLSVESSLIPIIDVIFEHRMYLPSVGVFVAIGTGVLMVLERYGLRNWVGRAVASVSMLVIIVLTATTYARNTVWQSGITLWKDVVRKSPDYYMAHYNLGVVYQDAGRLEEAIKEYLKAIRLRPDYTAAYSNLGSAYISLGDREKAIEYYAIAVSLEPGHAMAHYNLGVIYLDNDSLDLAQKEFETALKFDPTLYQARQFLQYMSNTK